MHAVLCKFKTIYIYAIMMGKNQEAMNLKEIREEYMRYFGATGQRGNYFNIHTISKTNKAKHISYPGIMSIK